MQKHRRLYSIPSLFESLRQYRLMVKPSRVQIGYEKVSFLKHAISNELLKLEKINIKNILDIKTPKFKKQVCSLL